MSTKHKLLVWTWVLRFLVVVRFIAGLILIAAVITHAKWIKEFFKSDQTGWLATPMFLLAVIAPLIGMYLWFNNYGRTAAMIREQVLSVPQVLRLSYNLFAIYALEVLAGIGEMFGPHFSMQKSSNFDPHLPANVANEVAQQMNGAPISFSFDLSAKIPYITPVTEGLATLVLATVLLYWARSLSENRQLKSELEEII